jgi:hypothetical protein
VSSFVVTPIPREVAYGISRGDTLAYCATCNGLIHSSVWKFHENFHLTFTNRSDGNMSSVLWCDTGNHAFKAGSPGAAHFEGTQTDADGVPQTMTQDVCAEHNPYAPAAEKEKAERLRLTAQAESELLNRGE